jgi:hypothetical protein
MKHARNRRGRLALMLAALFAAEAGTWAGETAASPSVPPPRPPALPEAPPLPPAPPTPVDRFRELLEKSPAEREAFLATRSPEPREYLRARLAEFDALPAAERELRLHLLNLRHYLLPLLRLPPEQRGEPLRQVPPAYRELVAERLAAWDRLGPEQRAELLASGPVLAGLPLQGTASAPTASRLAGPVPPGRREQFQRDLERWEALPESERARILARFEAFLEFSESEKARVLAGLDTARRAQAARLVQALEALPAPERARSLEALQRLANLPPEQRERFLHNAARWRAMSEEERQTWRRLHALLPPAPPGLDLPPPLPRSPAPAASGPPGLTNARAPH